LDVGSERTQRRGQSRTAGVRRRCLHDQAAVGLEQTHLVEGDAVGNHLVQHACFFERAQRVALHGDPVPDAVPHGADLDQVDLRAALGQGERQHAAGDAAADHEYLRHAHDVLLSECWMTEKT
jgi:hypothetical protein